MALEKAFLEGVADSLLFHQALTQVLVQTGRGEGGQRVVHLGLFGPPLALKSVGGQQLGLGGRALVSEVCLEI